MDITRHTPDLSDRLRPAARLQLVELPRRDDECWLLRDRYVEMVWVELLGVTTLAVARWLDLLMSGDPPARATSLAALATPLHVAPGKIVASLRRLHHHRLVVWRPHFGVIGLSGFARPVDLARLPALSPYGARLHHALTGGLNPAVATLEPADIGVDAGAGRGR